MPWLKRRRAASIQALRRCAMRHLAFQVWVSTGLTPGVSSRLAGVGGLLQILQTQGKK
jgi:hypothetical protein